MPNAPAAWCAHSGSEYAHQYSQRRHRKHPAFPTQWFYGFLRALPGDHRFVDPVIRATRWRLANLTPASGRQNHTASPSATRSARRTLRCVHRIPPHVRDDRERPSCRGGMRGGKHRFLKNGRCIFARGERAGRVRCPRVICPTLQTINTPDGRTATCRAHEVTLVCATSHSERWLSC